MKWSLNLRIFGLLRRLVIAAEGIHEQLKYSNDRTFPPGPLDQRRPEANSIQPKETGRVKNERNPIDDIAREIKTIFRGRESTAAIASHRG